jgi:CDP-diacylglycerol---serine O-phosphatidyltransferase
MSPSLRLKTDPRRVTVVVPSLFTLANLFFGIWSIVLANQGQFYKASWWIVIAGVLDMLDGRIARFSNTGSEFGAELDSLVDLVSFGVAPALLISQLLFFQIGGFAWLFAYGYIVCVTLRLARYNLHLDEGTRSTFTGLPSTAAGMTLATYFPFTQTPFFRAQLADLPWSQIIIFLTIALSLAMVSNISYAKTPRIGVKTVKGLLGLATHLVVIGFLIWSRDIFFFPLGLTYLTYGIIRMAVVSFGERGEDGEDEDSNYLANEGDKADESHQLRRVPK